MGKAVSKIQKALIKADLPPLPQAYTWNGSCYQHKKEGVKIRAYTLVLPPEEVEEYISRNKIRKEHKEELVQIRYVDVKKQQFEYIKMNVFYEYIPVNMEQIAKVRWQQMLAIIFFAAKGLKWLYRYMGQYFTVESYMIGLNEMGQVKMWLNRNYWQQTPKTAYSPKAANPQHAQQNMIEELMQIFRCKCEKNTIPDDFEIKGETFEKVEKELQGRYGLDWMKNNLPLVGDLQPNQPDTSFIDQLNLPQSKVNIESNVRPMTVVSSGKNTPVINFTTCQPTSTLRFSSSTPKIKFNYNRQVSVGDMKAGRSSSAAKRSSPQKINFSYKGQ